jgi:hypothetical protein
VHSLKYLLGKVVGSLGHVVRQIIFELKVLAVVGSVENHAQEVAFAAHLFGLLDLVLAGNVNLLGLHSLLNKLCGHKPWLLTIVPGQSALPTLPGLKRLRKKRMVWVLIVEKL